MASIPRITLDIRAAQPKTSFGLTTDTSRWRSTESVRCAEHDNDDNVRTNRVGWSRFPGVTGWGI
eukprot:646972-Rhodomonas_salina.1